MKYFASVLLGFSLALPVWGQSPATTMPSATGDAPAAAGSTDPLLGKTFRSRLDGIEFNPLAGGTMLRELNTGEIVRFVYPDNSWDIRVKPINLHTPLALTSHIGDGGVLEMTVAQMKADTHADILKQEVKPMAAGGADVGLIEARYNAGISVIFAQEAIIKDTDQHYFEVQMSAPGKPANAAPNAEDPNETEARKMFQHMVSTVTVLDRQALREEQIHRVYATTLLWVQVDKKKILSTIIPQHFMRVLQNGKDIGFVQVDERVAVHHGAEGVEYIVHSTVKTGADQVTDAARTQPAAPGVPGTPGSSNVVVPNGIVPPTGAPGTPAAPTNLYTNSTYFVTFDRDHEDWTTTTQVDQQVASQLTEMGNSDRSQKVALDHAAAAREAKNWKTGTHHGEPPTTQKTDYVLQVSQYALGGHVGKPTEPVELPPFYLPQAMGQLLPRLLPNDKEKYMFAFYVSNQKNVMARYVDVDAATDVVLDGEQVHAIPISDRIGVDGITTIHYVSRQGEWLGSVNEESKLQVLPTDATALSRIWKNFAVCPVPPLPEEPQVVKKPATRPVAQKAE